MKHSAGVDENPKKLLRMILGKTTAPIVSVVGRSNSGKTTLLEKLIAELKQRGFCVGTIKHDIHGFEMDRPGKDSWRHKQAGASTTIISSPNKIGMVMDVDHDHKPEELIPLLSNIDIILTEGYKNRDHPKLEVFRSDVHKDPICKGDKNLLALICDEKIDLGVPRFSTDDIEKITEFIVGHFNLQHASSSECKHVAS
jgi:molybdopterin-guanine dinucleotide biosynthesis protein B